MTQTASKSATSVASATATPRRGDAIDQWLAMFARFLRLPAEQGRAIRDELDSHMRERVRDLMLEGLSEDEGMRRAIDELGEAAELAAHFRAAHKPNRRLAMSIAAIGVAAGAAVISVVALSNSQPPRAEAPVAGLATRIDPGAKPSMAATAASAGLDPRTSGGVPMLAELPIVGSVFTTQASTKVMPASPADPAGVKVSGEFTDMTVETVFDAIAQQAGKKLAFRTTKVAARDLRVEKLKLVDADLPTAVRELNAVTGLLDNNRLDYRVRGDLLDVGTVQDFDRQESTLIAYDLRDAYACDARTEDLVSAVLQFVESDGWRDNGGTTACLKIVGTKMFVEAPPRYHERVAWILSQFSRRAGRAGEAPANAAPALRPAVGGGSGGAEGAATAAPVGAPGGMSPGGTTAAEAAASGFPGMGATATPKANNPVMAPAGASPFAGREAPGGAANSTPATDPVTPKLPPR